MLINNIIAILIAYLIGSISSAIVVCRIMRLPDPRTQGSRNPGATNVLRIGGKKAAIITLLGDALKGFLPIIIARVLGFDDTVLGLIAFAAFLGHLFPVYFRFEGGKGVATLIGCLLALNWPTGLCFLATWGLIAVIFRYSSLASLVATLLSPIFIWMWTGNWVWVGVAGLMSVALIIRHRENIVKLAKGQESKIGKR